MYLVFDLDGGNVVHPFVSIHHFSIVDRSLADCSSRTDGERGNVSSMDLGLVNEVLRKIPRNMEGDLGIGHARYSTTGASVAEMQHLVLSILKGHLHWHMKPDQYPGTEMGAIQNGAIFHTTTDSEVIAFHVARERVHSKTVEEAVLKMPVS
ncbi:MAG: hypothetical protein ACLUD0_17125 [Eubacterium ramulus]